MIAHREDVMLEDLELFQSFAVLVERSNGLPQMRVLSFDKQGAFAAIFAPDCLSRAYLQRASARQPRICNRQVSLWVSITGFAHLGL